MGFVKVSTELYAIILNCRTTEAEERGEAFVEQYVVPLCDQAHIMSND